MKVVWKFPLALADRQLINMPTGAKLLTVQMQDVDICLWALVDPDAAPVQRAITVAGTGHTMLGETGKYVATFQMAHGELVFHVFDHGEVK